MDNTTNQIKAMKDTPSMLPDGAGTPYVTVFDETGAPIIDPISGLNIGALTSSFEYIYQEDDPDEGKMVIECNNPDLVSHDKLADMMHLQLQWGWIYPDGSVHYSNVRHVMVSGREVTFGPQGTIFTLKFASAGLLLKDNPSRMPDGDTDSMLLWISTILDGIPVSAEIINHQVDENAERVVVAELKLTNPQLKASLK